MITKEQYSNLKEYWDYQRLIEYNKELLKSSLEEIKQREFIPNNISTDDMFEHVWVKVKESDYETPPKSWIPKDLKYRFEWEDEPKDTKKGRPVVLRAKSYNE